MLEVPALRGLKQSQDGRVTVSYSANVGVAANDSARMDLRVKLEDPAPLDTFRTANGRLLISANTVVMLFNGEVTALWTTPYVSFPKVDANGNPVLDSDGNPVQVPGFVLYGTLIVTDSAGVDRPAPIDLQFYIEGSYTRGAG